MAAPALPPVARVAIDDVRAAAFTVPTDQPEADGTLTWDRTTLVVVQITAGGERGLGYTYSAPGAAQLIEQQLAPVIQEHDAMDIARVWLANRARLRNLGQEGIAATAVSAVDVALWDLKARLLGLSVAKLIGCHRERVPVYGSGGFTSYPDEALTQQFSGWREQGITRFKMKVGREPERDLRRVRTARAAIGREAELFVDANSAYTRNQARMSAEIFAHSCDIRWLEEPLAPQDLRGLCFLREHMPVGVEIAEGEYGYELDDFRRLLEADAADVVMPDATRCGGVTGFLKVAALCEACHKPMSCHCAPALHATIGAVVPQVRHIEYFHDHVRIENLLFSSLPRLRDGELEINDDQAGFGWEFHWEEAERFRD
jgi:L-alanine-DL-glutamate epimerase-like enolase superfamily enzyme